MRLLYAEGVGVTPRRFSCPFCLASKMIEDGAAPVVAKRLMETDEDICPGVRSGSPGSWDMLVQQVVQLIVESLEFLLIVCSLLRLKSRLLNRRERRLLVKSSIFFLIELIDRVEITCDLRLCVDFLVARACSYM